MLEDSNQTEWENQVVDQDIEEKMDPNSKKMHEAIGKLHGKPAHEAAYAIIEGLGHGEIDFEWFKENVGDLLNNFPPTDYMARHAQQFTPGKCRNYLKQAASSESFRKSPIYQTMMGDKGVLHRYQLIAGNFGIDTNGSSEEISEDLIQHFNNTENERRQEAEVGWAADVPTEKVSGWRNWIKSILGQKN